MHACLPVSQSILLALLLKAARAYSFLEWHANEDGVANDGHRKTASLSLASARRIARVFPTLCVACGDLRTACCYPIALTGHLRHFPFSRRTRTDQFLPTAGLVTCQYSLAVPLFFPQARVLPLLPSRLEASCFMTASYQGIVVVFPL